MFYGSTSGGFEPSQMYVIFKKFLSAVFDKLNTIDYIIQCYLHTTHFYQYSFISIIRNLMAHANEIATAFTIHKYTYTYIMFLSVIIQINENWLYFPAQNTGFHERMKMEKCSPIVTKIFSHCCQFSFSELLFYFLGYEISKSQMKWTFRFRCLLNL